MTTTAAALAANLELALADANRAVLAIGAGFEALAAGLRRLLGDGRRGAAVSRAEAEALLGELSRIAVGLQFEDILSQRVRLVARALTRPGPETDFPPTANPDRPEGDIELF